MPGPMHTKVLRPRRFASGLTLIELLVAVVIFGIFAVMAYGGLGRLMDSRERVLDEQQFWEHMSLVFLRLSDDLAHARLRGIRDVGGFARLPFEGRPTDTRALGDPDLEFTRGGELHYGEGVHSELRRVAWRLRERRLERMTWPVLDRAPTTTPTVSPLLDKVDAFELKFYDAQGIPSTTWPPASATANPTAAVDLPRAIEVALTVNGRGVFRRLFLVNR